MLQHEPRDPVRRTLADDLGARVFHHLAEMNAGRTHGFASPAIQASEHVLAESVGDAGAAFIQGAHQVDAAARRIHLAAEHAVRRTRRQTQAAVNAIEVKLILRRCGGQGSVSFQDRMCASYPASNALQRRARQTSRPVAESPAVLAR